MRFKHALPALAMAAVLSLYSPRAQAQVVGGYVGFGSPGVVTYGAPVVAPAPLVVPYSPVYPAAVPRPWVGVGPVYGTGFYGPGWGYSSGYYGVRRVYPGYGYPYRHGRRWW